MITSASGVAGPGRSTAGSILLLQLCHVDLIGEGNNVVMLAGAFRRPDTNRRSRCARRSDDTDAPSRVASDPLAAGLALILPPFSLLNDCHPRPVNAYVAHYPLAAGFTVADMQPRSFTAEQLLAICRPAGVGRVNLIQMSYYEFDNRTSPTARPRAVRHTSGPIRI